MLSQVEVWFNLLWLGLLCVGGWIVAAILKRRDPFDDEEEQVEDGERAEDRRSLS
jgi:hypothetical protein